MAEETIETKLKNYQVLTSWQQEKIAVLEARIKKQRVNTGGQVLRVRTRCNSGLFRLNDKNELF